jgi:hypothetical protein
VAKSPIYRNLPTAAWIEKIQPQHNRYSKKIRTAFGITPLQRFAGQNASAFAYKNI